jgi:hypothetical protein
VDLSQHFLDNMPAAAGVCAHATTLVALVALLISASYFSATLFLPLLVSTGSDTAPNGRDPADPHDSSPPPSQLELLLGEYSAVHRKALASPPSSASSTSAAGSKPAAHMRWVVASLAPHADLCGRAMHLTASLLLAALTDRALVFDWRSAPVSSHDESQFDRVLDFGEIFAIPPLAMSYREALLWRGLSEDDAPRLRSSGYILSGGGVGTESDSTRGNRIDEAALRHLRLDALFSASDRIIHVDHSVDDRDDWWGAALFANPHYRAVLGDLGPARGFGVLFRYLFQPKQWRDLPPFAECDVLFQMRRRDSVHAASFLRCAADNGLLSRQSDGRVTGVGTQYLQTDHSDEHLATASDLARLALQHAGLSVHSLADSCQTPPMSSLACQQAALSSVYYAARCRGAVLSANSTAGLCAVALGLIEKAFVVENSGACRALSLAERFVEARQRSSASPSVSSSRETAATAASALLAAAVQSGRRPVQGTAAAGSQATGDVGVIEPIAQSAHARDGASRAENTAAAATTTQANRTRHADDQEL